MTTQSQIQKTEVNVKAEAISSLEQHRPHAANPHAKTIEPDYSSMWEAIQEIADPVPFEEIKQFYNI